MVKFKLSFLHHLKHDIFLGTNVCFKHFPILSLDELPTVSLWPILNSVLGLGTCTCVVQFQNFEITFVIFIMLLLRWLIMWRHITIITSCFISRLKCSKIVKYFCSPPSKTSILLSPISNANQCMRSKVPEIFIMASLRWYFWKLNYCSFSTMKS